MFKKRPRIKIPMTPFDMIAEMVAAAVLLSGILLMIVLWGKIPHSVPNHFNMYGEIDGYSGKNTLVVLMAVQLGLYSLLSIVSKFPHVYNYIVEITDNNARRQYLYAIRLMRFVKLEITSVFTYIHFVIILSAINGKSHFSAGFLPAFLIIIFATLGYYIYRSLKAR